MKKETEAVHTGTQYDQKTKGTNTPIYTSTAIGNLDLKPECYPTLRKNVHK